MTLTQNPRAANFRVVEGSYNPSHVGQGELKGVFEEIIMFLKLTLRHLRVSPMYSSSGERHFKNHTANALGKT